MRLSVKAFAAFGLPAVTLLAPISAGARAQSAGDFCASVCQVSTAISHLYSEEQQAPANRTTAIRSVEILGASVVPAKDVSAAASKVAVGKNSGPVVLQQATKAVIDLYRQRGYPVAQVTSAEIDAQGVLHLTIAEGTISRVVVRGNRGTRLSTILLALSLRPGDIYSETRARRDRDRLANLGIFDDVVIEAQVPGTEDTDIEPLSSASAKVGKSNSVALPPDLSQGSTPDNSAPKDNPAAGSPAAAGTKDLDKQTWIGLDPSHTAQPMPPNDEVGQVDLVVRVKEHKTFNIAATIGYADAIGPVGFLDLSEINVAGMAQRIDVEWQRISESYVNTDGSLAKTDSRQALDFLYEKPALNPKATSLSLSVYEKNTVFLPFFAGQDQTFRTFEKRNGATVKIGHALGTKLTGYMTLRRADVGYDEFQGYYSGPQPPDVFVTEANARIAAVGAEVVADSRDAAENPRHGYLHSLRYEDAGAILGGNRAFSQTTADFRVYTPVNGVKDGPVFALRFLGGYSAGNAPLSEFYFLGGYEILRGYDLYSIYGDRMLVSTGEIRVRLTQGLLGVVFLEEGGAWLPGDAITLRGLQTDGGLGLRFLSPIGPIRFDAAYGSSLKTYVTLGQSF